MSKKNDNTKKEINPCKTSSGYTPMYQVVVNGVIIRNDMRSKHAARLLAKERSERDGCIAIARVLRKRQEPKSLGWFVGGVEGLTAPNGDK